MTATTHRDRAEWLALALALLLLGLSLGYTLKENHDYIDRTERDRLQAQARVIEISLGRQIEAVDQALLAAQAALAAPAGTSSGPPPSQWLALLHRTLPGVHTLSHAGADGTVIAASRDDVIGTRLAQRPYFKRAQAQPDALLLYVAEPHVSAHGVASVALVRVLIGPAGEFAGIVEAALAPAYFNVVLDAVRYAPDMRALMIHANGRLFLNLPADDAILATDVSQPGSLFRRHLDGGAQSSVLRGRNLVGEDRLVALRTLHRTDLGMDRPLLVSVSRDAAAVFGPWREIALFRGAYFVALGLAAGFGLHFLQRQRRAREQLSAAHAAELGASEARFRSLTRLSSDWYWEQDASLRFVRSVGGSVIPTTMSMEPFIGRKRWDTPALNLGDEEWARHRATLEARQEFRDFVMARADAGGVVRWMSVSGEPIFDAGGTFCGYRGTGRDITEQMRDKEALRLSEERLQLILRGSHDAPWDLDLHSDTLWLAQGWTTLLGWESGTQRLTPALWQERCHPDDAAAVAQVFHDALKGRAEDYEVELRMRHRDGHYVPMLMRGYILRNDQGRAIRASGVNTDLSERKRAEADREQLARAQADEQLRQLELAASEQARTQAEQHAQGLVALLAERERTIVERDQLLGLLAHEVRQPLNNASAAIQSAAMAMTDPQFSPQAACDRLERAQLVLDQVANTVNNALSASVLLTGTERITTREADLDTVIGLVLADLGTQARARVRARRLTRGRTAEINIALVRLALRNLLANALAYSPEDTLVELCVDLSDDPLALVLEVRDRGEGIAPELRPVLFERGSRGSQSRAVPGAGLGLYVVAQVVALHHGSVEVLPNEPCGTVFRIVLPQGRLD